MPRVKRSTKRSDRRKKILKRASGYFLTKSKLYQAAQEAVERGLKFAYIGRKQKKRQFRSLWIVRIGAAARNNGMSYSTFINETRATLIAADAALVVVDAHAGVQVVTEKVWDYCSEYDLPRAILINRMDLAPAGPATPEDHRRSAAALKPPCSEDLSGQGIDFLTSGSQKSAQSAKSG